MLKNWGEDKMVMMMNYCVICEKERWFTLDTQVTTIGSVYVWRCNLCGDVVPYVKPRTSLDEYLYEILLTRQEILQ